MKLSAGAALPKMFSYLHNIRPSNRRSAVATFTTASPTGLPRQYQEPSVIARETHRSVIVQDENSSSISSPSPISPDPPVIPPITLGAYAHESPLSKETVTRSPRLTMDQVEKTRPDQKGSLVRTSGLPLGGKFTTVPAANSHGEAEESQPRKPQSFVSGSSQLQQEQKFYLQTEARTPSQENTTFIPPPDRPPPPPPVGYAKPEKPAPIGLHQARHGKTKLNLLNPMSILTRRKSSQPVPQANLDKHSHAKGSDRPTLGLSDDYDPRIRGNIIHDFSAPQTGRLYSSNNVNALSRENGQGWKAMGKNQSKLSPGPNSSLSDEESPNTAERQHTPVFKEHFDDDIGQSNSSSIARESLKPSAFMYQVALKESYLESEPDSSSLPPFARNLASKLSKATEAADQTLVSKGSLEVVHETSLPDETSPSLPLKSSSPVSPPKVRSRASSNADSPFQPGSMPKRFTSNASRFSFDMAGVGSSAQEKILEERHRQKAKDKARISDASTASQRDDYWNEEENGETYSGYNSMDDDADFEESIPGVNADADKGSGNVPSHDIPDLQALPPIRSSLSGLAISDKSDMARIDKSSASPDESTHRSSSNLWPNPLKQRSLDDPSSYTKTVLLSGHGPGLGIAVSPSDHAHPLPPEDTKEKKSMAPLAGIPRHYKFQDDDDLYFDDGMIEDVDTRDNEAFDESVFDDDTSKIYGLPLRYLKPSDIEHKKGELFSDHMSSQSHAVDTDDTVIPNTAASGLEAPQSLPRPGSNSFFVESSSESRNSFHQASGLTQDNLAAYHDALAYAANQAAINGEFTRSESDAEQRPVKPSNELTAGIPANGSRNQEVHGLPSKFDFQDPDDFDYDDALSDDPIIAAANAEALENDDEGFYGREFGFYARASGTGEYANGGYFGPQGVEGIGRSHSGRVNFQEPSLTPITERSEWSNRNSAISLALHGYSQSAQQAMSSPGLAQLADMMSLEEDDLSLSALMKLRRDAWGGSTTSLPSSHSNGSQLNLLSVMTPGSGTAATNPTLSPNIRSSTHSINSSNSFNSTDSDASPSSPTITIPAHTVPQKDSSSSSESPPIKPHTLHNTSESNVPSIRPRSAQLAEQAKGHKRKSSGAETVSYTHEEDGGSGGRGRWVVEKRRVSEGGKVELLGREVVEGSRI